MLHWGYGKEVSKLVEWTAEVFLMRSRWLIAHLCLPHKHDASFSGSIVQPGLASRAMAVLSGLRPVAECLLPRINS